MGYPGTVQSPTVSILLPTYNPHAAHLQAALQSIKNQTYQNYQVFIRDDASSIDVRNIVEPFLSDPRIRFERGNTRLGIGGNWNACVQNSTGELVQFLFQDDTWEPTYLEHSVKALSDPSVGFVTSAHVYSVEGEEPFALQAKSYYKGIADMQNTHLPEGIHNAHTFLNKWVGMGLRPNVIGEPSFVMLRLSLMNKAGPFALDLKQILDTEYWVRCLQHAEKFVKLSENLGTFRVHAKSATSGNATVSKRWKERFGFFVRHPSLAIRVIL